MTPLIEASPITTPMTIPSILLSASIILTPIISPVSCTTSLPVIASNQASQLVLDNALVDLVGLVLDRLTSLVATVLESPILALMVESDRVIDHMIVKLLVPSDVEMQLVVEYDSTVVISMVVTTTPALL